LALPGDVPLLDLLPAVLARLGHGLADQGVDHEGWVLQRLGEAPLDETRTPAELNLLDGEMVYLRPRSDQLPPVDWDDLVDGVADQVRKRTDVWTPRLSRWMLVSAAAAALLTGFVLVLLSGPTVPSAATAVGFAVVLLVFASVVSRVVRDPVTATVLAGVGFAYAVLGGWFGPEVLDPGVALAPRLASTCVLGLAALAIGLAGVADAALLFVGALTFLMLVLVPVLIAALSAASGWQAASVGLVLTVVVGLFVPVTAFKLGGLTLPALPATAEQLQEDIDPVNYQMVVDKGVATAGYQTALHLALGAAQLVLAAVVVDHGATWPMILAAVFALVLFLRSRHLGGAVQRWSMLAPAGLTVVLELLRIGIGSDPFTRMTGVWAPLLVAAMGLLLASAKLPERRLRPYWGRAVEIFESMAAISLLPLLLAVLDIYHLMRGLAG
jgi:type VII secretion integral membrane protein EccD